MKPLTAATSKHCGQLLPHVRRAHRTMYHSALYCALGAVRGKSGDGALLLPRGVNTLCDGVPPSQSASRAAGRQPSIVRQIGRTHQFFELGHCHSFRCQQQRVCVTLREPTRLRTLSKWEMCSGRVREPEAMWACVQGTYTNTTATPKTKKQITVDLLPGPKMLPWARKRGEYWQPPCLVAQLNNTVAISVLSLLDFFACFDGLWHGLGNRQARELALNWID